MGPLREEDEEDGGNDEQEDDEDDEEEDDDDTEPGSVSTPEARRPSHGACSQLDVQVARDNTATVSTASTAADREIVCRVPTHHLRAIRSDSARVVRSVHGR